MSRRSAIARMCSTPFGVTVFFTQRLAGNESRHRVLNAFRRHCLLHTTSTTWPAPRWCGAQRLSASLSSSRNPHHGGRGHRRVLNAFRRYCLLHIGAFKASSDEIPCSTPFGVTV